MARTTMDQVFDRAFYIAVEEAFGESVGYCDVCREDISRAESHIMRMFKRSFGCIKCSLPKLGTWERK